MLISRGTRVVLAAPIRKPIRVLGLPANGNAAINIWYSAVSAREALALVLALLRWVMNNEGCLSHGDLICGVCQHQ